ncbi:DUF6946 family protein [Chloroflexota bacterium]
MSKFFIPTNTTEDWQSLLADPDKHWKTGYSAKALAYSWQKADGFPAEVKEVFKNSGIDLFQDIQMLLAFPEYKVSLPGGKRVSQNDILILAKKGAGQLISIAVEGKVDEPFGELIADWKLKDKGGKKVRLEFLCEVLQLDVNGIDCIRYQLLHRTASALIEARKFNARNALMLVHAFKKTEENYDQSFRDYCQFLELFGPEGKSDSIVRGKRIGGINLYFGWVKGNKRYLEK